MSRSSGIRVLGKITKQKLLSPARLRVFADLVHHGPSTAGEITKRLSTVRTANPSFHRRLSELEFLGVVERKRRTLCPVSGRSADLWEITGKLPCSSIVPRAPKGILKESMFLGLAEIYFLIHRYRRIEPNYNAPKHLNDLCFWISRHGVRKAMRDKVAVSRR